MAIKIHMSPCPLWIVSAYLPCRSGCTDSFKEALDYLDSIICQLFDCNVIVLDDLNADVGAFGGPLATNTPNEQVKILLWYLCKWSCVCPPAQM